MKRKFADFPTMKRVVKKEYTNKYISNEEFEGNVSLLKILKVSEPKIVKESEFELKIADDDYKWLELYPNNCKVALSVLYNNKNEIVEWYFDIIKNMGIENEIPYIDDLYLDVVVMNDGKIILLDEDELKQALIEKDITEEDYKMAYSVANDLIKRLEGNLESLIAFSNKYFNLFK